MAINLLKFFSIGSDDGVAFMVGVLGAGAAGFEFAAGVGRIYTWSVEGATGSGLWWLGQWQWGSISMGNDLRTCFLGSPTAFFPLPSSVSNGEIASSCILYCSSTLVSIRHSFSGFSSF